MCTCIKRGCISATMCSADDCVKKTSVELVSISVNNIRCPHCGFDENCLITWHHNEFVCMECFKTITLKIEGVNAEKDI